MSEGIWTIRPCPHRQASGLAKELGLSEITASVLVRRGYGDPEVARAFLAGEQPLHDPFLLGDMAGAVVALARGRSRVACAPIVDRYTTRPGFAASRAARNAVAIDLASGNPGFGSNTGRRAGRPCRMPMARSTSCIAAT